MHTVSEKHCAHPSSRCTPYVLSHYNIAAFAIECPLKHNNNKKG